jgi:environmental stress-induced protein Ves
VRLELRVFHAMHHFLQLQSSSRIALSLEFSSVRVLLYAHNNNTTILEDEDCLQFEVEQVNRCRGENRQISFSVGEW